jgi:hypothetical protein
LFHNSEGTFHTEEVTSPHVISAKSEAQDELPEPVEEKVVSEPREISEAAEKSQTLERDLAIEHAQSTTVAEKAPVQRGRVETETLLDTRDEKSPAAIDLSHERAETHKSVPPLEDSEETYANGNSFMLITNLRPCISHRKTYH